MSCPGLHCPGCSSGQSAVILGAIAGALVVLDRVSTYVAGRIWWIGGTLAVCSALAAAASMALERRSDRRAAEWGAARGILSRADVILPAPRTQFQSSAPGTVSPLESPAGRSAIAPQVAIFNFYGPAGDAQAAVIRNAIPGPAGDAITEGK